MDLLREVWDQGRRATVDVLSSGGIERDSPFSPDVPDDLRNWLPDLFDRFPVVLPWERPQPVDPALHSIWILDNTAFRSPQQGDNRPDLPQAKDQEASDPVMIGGNGSPQPASGSSGWEVEIVAAYFIKNSGQDPAKAVASIAKHLNVDKNDVATRKRIAARLEPFTHQVLPNRTLRISIDGKEEQTLGPSSYSGISDALHGLHFSPTNPGVVETTPVNLPPPFSLPGSTVIADESGWGVISDIDDTIKVTMTPSPVGILKSTFIVETPQTITGMPEFYSHMSSTLSQPPFFYVSASPYNLYPFLKTFRNAHYPQGTIMLRDASWQNLGGLITSLSKNVKEYKDDRFQKIHAWFPHRRFVCLGDSTQSDPESYAEAARKYPGWIKAVFIRKVTGIAEMDEKSKNSPERFEKAFRGLDRRLWHVFTDPRELAERVDRLARDPNALVGGA